LLLVESLTRQRPKLEKAGDAAVQLPDSMAEPFRSIVQACMQRDPANRCSIQEIRHMLEQPIELTMTPAQVVPIRTEPKPDLKLQKEETVPQPSPERMGTSDSKHAVDLKPLLDERESPQSRSLKFAPLAIAILVAIAAIFALIRFTWWHASETKPQAEVAASTVSPTGVQPIATAAVSPVLRSASGAVATQVMPEVSHVAQNSIHGVVKVRVQLNVNELGEVTLAGLAAHGPSRYFARQALDAARQWSFTAPVADGKPVSSRWMIEFDFRRSGVKAESRMIHPKAS
jgi:TonB family protein